MLIGSHPPQASPFVPPSKCSPELHASACTLAGESPWPAQDLLRDFQLHGFSWWLFCLPQLALLFSQSEYYGLPISVSPKANVIPFQPVSPESSSGPPVFRSYVTPSSSVLIFAFPKPNLHYNYSSLARPIDLGENFGTTIRTGNHTSLVSLGLSPPALGLFLSF